MKGRDGRTMEMGEKEGKKESNVDGIKFEREMEKRLLGSWR